MDVIQRYEVDFDPYTTFSREHLLQVHMDLNADHDTRIAYENELFEHKILLRNIEHRFKISYGQPKKYYVKLLKYTKESINYHKNAFHTNPQNDYQKELWDNYIEKEKKIKFIISTFNKDTKKLYNIPAAKQYPMENLLSFNAANFTKCIYHDEKTPSMYFNPQKNNVHCFSCGKNADTIDVTMHLHKKSFGEAVKFLSHC